MDSQLTSSAISLQNILFATDFSVCSELALSYATALCQRYGSVLYTAHVVREELSDVQPPDPFYLLHSAQRKMQSLSRSGQLAEIRHHELLREGDVSPVLCELIEGLGIDLLVLGTRGRGGIKKLLLGSIAEEIVGQVSCPVWTVGPQVSTENAARGVKKIVYAADLQRGSDRALAFALGMAAQERAHLTLVHVVKPLSDTPGDYIEAAVDASRKQIRELVPSGVPIETDFLVEVGLPADCIERVASLRKADLIVMGAHHGSSARLSSHLPWVTPHYVVCHANCPVVTVREARPEAARSEVA
ncbi:MAG: universal stress protein [Terriglobales bacterium]